MQEKKIKPFNINKILKREKGEERARETIIVPAG